MKINVCDRIYIYIYIYVCVCVCVRVVISISPDYRLRVIPLLVVLFNIF